MRGGQVENGGVGVCEVTWGQNVAKNDRVDYQKMKKNKFIFLMCCICFRFDIIVEKGTIMVHEYIHDFQFLIA